LTTFQLLLQQHKQMHSNRYFRLAVPQTLSALTVTICVKHVLWFFFARFFLIIVAFPLSLVLWIARDWLVRHLFHVAPTTNAIRTKHKMFVNTKINLFFIVATHALHYTLKH
jgi:hypothetical protein